METVSIIRKLSFLFKKLFLHFGNQKEGKRIIRVFLKKNLFGENHDMDRTGHHCADFCGHY